MIRILLRIVLKNLPWVLLLTVVVWVLITGKLPFYQGHSGENTEVKHDVVLQKLVSLGKLELIKYQFKEITEVKNTSQWKIFFHSYSPDMKAALITSGEAVGCMDLTKIMAQDVVLSTDSLIISLPPPELCYYKIDLENSRIYDLETGYLATDEEERAFVEEVYKSAEIQIKNAALDSGILLQTQSNAKQFLTAFLEEISGRKVRLNFKLSAEGRQAL
ncbi:DUF4230 domain-containing protein [Fulvivirgaceae bacterium BMA12]|uniref:DUF4230 domain-containing protein n=1 Tax=Agaribacillus aureus TaxID=3051825 RepID=A0ABT8L906_9BACT|nr:DUF4230 domain-containing protein [Fulvivirgaceae bacterium BMA12]